MFETDDSCDIALYDGVDVQYSSMMCAEVERRAVRNWQFTVGDTVLVQVLYCTSMAWSS